MKAKNMNNRELIDAFKVRYSLTHDLDVAVVLDVARPSISDWTSGKRPMPVPTKFRLLDHIGYPGTEAFLKLFVDVDEHKQLMEIERERIESLVDIVKRAKQVLAEEEESRRQAESKPSKKVRKASKR